jgi:3-oxoacyl-[acyl-carrier-protein] synthase-3
MERFANIIITGRYLAEIEMPNSVLREQLAHVPDFVDKMEASTGIRKRWYAPEIWATSGVALPTA